ILGPDSVAAGKMALAALDIDSTKYEELNDALMNYNGNLTEQVAYKIAGSLGYNIAELKERAGSAVIDERLNRNYQLAQSLGLQGTPAFIVGSEVIRGYLPVDDMLSAINDARLEQRGG
ncbi:MAG: DsbA family protein, partial [Pseudomonadota bacterium]